MAKFIVSILIFTGKDFVTWTIIAIKLVSVSVAALHLSIYPLQQLCAIQGITSTFVLAFAIDNWAAGWLCLYHKI